MSEEEKKIIEELKEEINKPVEMPEDKFNTFILYNIESAKTLLNLISNLQKELEYKDNIIHGLGTEVLPISIEGFEVLLNKTKEENDKLQKELDKKDKEIKQLRNTILNYQGTTGILLKMEDKDE